MIDNRTQPSEGGALASLIRAITSGGDATEGQRIEAILRAGELTSAADIASINDRTIDNLERFIRRKCASMTVDERKRFLEDDLLNAPERFMIAPGLSQRIINTCGKIGALYKAGGTLDGLSLLRDTRETKTTALSLASDPRADCIDLARYSSLTPPLLEQDSLNETRPETEAEIKRECSLDEDAFVKQEPGLVEGFLVANRSLNMAVPKRASRPKRHSVAAFRTNAMDYYYSKVVEDGMRLFTNCVLVPKEHFDIELDVKGKFENKRIANYVCYLCRSPVRPEKRLKFYLTEKGAVINSNIVNHLKVHFAYIIEK